MAIGDVQRRQGFNGRSDACNVIGVVDDPQGVAHARIGGEVRCRGGCGRLFQNAVDHRTGRMGKEDGSGLRIERLDLPDAIIFLVGAGEFMATDASFVVGGDRRCGDDARLRVVAHDEAVRVVAGMRVPLEDAFANHVCKIFRALGVDLRRIRIRAGWKINFGLGDMQEAPWLSGRARTRLLGVQHIVGRRRDVGGPFRQGPQTAKRIDKGQGILRSVNQTL